MQYTVSIKQVKALEWGLNAQQALLFAFVYECPSWANIRESADGTFYALAKGKIADELPLLTDKPDTVYRMLLALKKAGLIELSSTNAITLVRLTDKGRTWNRKVDGQEKYPTREELVGKKSEAGSEKNPIRVGKKSEAGSEKNPTNQGTNNQGTNQDTSNQVIPAAAAAGPAKAAAKKQADSELQEACRSTWTAYAAAYQNRYGAEPIRNAKVNNQVRQFATRIPRDEAPAVAAFYVGINDAFLVRNCHDFGSLLAKSETYRTQWVTGRQINGRTARQIEDRQANLSAGEEAARRIRERRSNGGARNEFL